MYEVDLATLSAALLANFNIVSTLVNRPDSPEGSTLEFDRNNYTFVVKKRTPINSLYQRVVYVLCDVTDVVGLTPEELGILAMIYRFMKQV